MWSQWMRLEASHFAACVRTSWVCVYGSLCVHRRMPAHVYPFYPAQNPVSSATSARLRRGDFSVVAAAAAAAAVVFGEDHLAKRKRQPKPVAAADRPSVLLMCFDLVGAMCVYMCICGHHITKHGHPVAAPFRRQQASLQREHAALRAGYLLCAHSFVTNGKIQFSPPRALTGAGFATAPGI